MPIVEVRYNANRLLDEVGTALFAGRTQVDRVRLFGQILQEIVSAALNAPPDGGLTPGDIEVFFSEIGPHDITSADVSIDIEAMAYPARAVNLEQRKRRIMLALRELFTSLFVSVWLKPVKASWGSDIVDSPPAADFDMSMEAALARCRKLLEA